MLTCPVCLKSRRNQGTGRICLPCKAIRKAQSMECVSCGRPCAYRTKTQRCWACYIARRKIALCVCGATAQADRTTCRKCQRKAEAATARSRYKSDPEYRAHRRSFRGKWKRASDGTVTAKWMANLLSNSTKCYYCCKPTPRSSRTVEHVIPLSLGGMHSVANIAMACRDCNVRKGARIWTII